MIDGRINVTIVDEDGCEVEEDSLLHLPENTSLFFLKDGEVLVSGTGCFTGGCEFMDKMRCC